MLLEDEIIYWNIRNINGISTDALAHNSMRAIICRTQQAVVVRIYLMAAVAFGGQGHSL